MPFDALDEIIGFEQALYFMFMRHLIKFHFFMGLLVIILILVWILVRTQDMAIILRRLVLPKDMQLMTVEANTGIACLYSTSLTLYLIVLRSRYKAAFALRLCVSEDQPSSTKGDLWFQVRSAKVRGVHPDDLQGGYLKNYIGSVLQRLKLPGKILKVTVLPCLEKCVALQRQIERLKSEYELFNRFDPSYGNSCRAKCCFRRW